MFKGSWVSSWLRGERDPLQAALGRLEREVMDVVWSSDEHTVKDVQGRLPRKAAYTTVMTTLDRLYKKGRAVSGPCDSSPRSKPPVNVADISCRDRAAA